VPTADRAQLETAFSEITRGQPDAIIVMPSAMLLAEHKYIAESIAKTRLPAMYPAREFVQDGGLMSYGASVTHVDRQNQPTRSELVVNLKTARELGIAFSREFLMLVNETVE
jgi:putative ABC transport system substrate-binding protein